jgi:hypothetical protein
MLCARGARRSLVRGHLRDGPAAQIDLLIPELIEHKALRRQVESAYA